ncbi:hypothetical protein [Microbulbifer sp. JSM ZJ756]|uniref:hypothetical protein n=1 Tax=Microbulbifer sp. JSM ZJ756 TaxID=3376191 RepID=UPI0037AF98C3
MKELVFVHGRAQQFKNPTDLKSEWVDAFRRGLKKNGLDLPIPESNIRFPYYGQTLHDLVTGQSAEDVARVIVKGEDADQEKTEFLGAVFEEIRQRFDITDSQLREVGGHDVIERGFLNWERVQTILKAIDQYVPGASGATVALFTNDVYEYLANPGLQSVIDSGVRSAIDSSVETVVVSHSLGTVVAYSLLRREGQSLGWNVPLHVTLGSPLALQVIKRKLSPIGFPACVDRWFNAMDERDVVALYPLTADSFPVAPPIENKTDVRNHTKNRHGIAGYLDDEEVASQIYNALVD